LKIVARPSAITLALAIATAPLLAVVTAVAAPGHASACDNTPKQLGPTVTINTNGVHAGDFYLAWYPCAKTVYSEIHWYSWTYVNTYGGDITVTNGTTTYHGTDYNRPWENAGPMSIYSNPTGARQYWGTAWVDAWIPGGGGCYGLMTTPTWNFANGTYNWSQGGGPVWSCP
jgi:hypothetical protein